MKKLHKGVTYDRANGCYMCQFYNKKAKRIIKKTSFRTPGEALRKYIDLEIEFHLENRGYLPKGIYINPSRNVFQLNIRGTSVYRNEDLEEVKKERTKVIKSLLDI